MYEYIKNRQKFYAVTKEEILKLEQTIGYRLSESFKQFYLEVGFGQFVFDDPKMEKDNMLSANLFLPPQAIADFTNGVGYDPENPASLESSDYWMMDFAYECLEKGEMPFFEEGDSSSFLTMKLESDTPEAIFRFDTKLADTFEEFIYRMYHEGVNYYCEIEDDEE